MDGAAAHDGRNGPFCAAVDDHKVSAQPGLDPATVSEADGCLFLGAAETVVGLTDAYRARPDLRGVYVPNGARPALSLVPPIHFALLDARHIHATFYDAIRAENWPAGLPTNALLISGPSKTADIQQTLAYGAHGPKELVVLMIEENI